MMNFNRKWLLLLLPCLSLSCLLLATASAAQGGTETSTPKQTLITIEQFNAWMDEVSNWGRWGEEDELGTLNLITPAERKAAADLVEDGVSISLALDLDKTRSDLNANPFEHSLSVVKLGDQVAAVDHYAVSYHGYAHSHIDGLPHFAHEGRMYNGVPASALAESGSERLGIENAKKGIFTRGVLIDMAWFKGVDYLDPASVITTEDLEAWEEKTGVTLKSGDVLLLRTGRWVRTQQEGDPAAFLEQAAGLHPSVALWLKKRDIAVIGSDGISDTIPSVVEGRPTPLHELALVGMGMMILDNLDLRELSTEAQARGRWHFLFVTAPLRVPGGTGSPVNPLAIF